MNTLERRWSLMNIATRLILFTSTVAVSLILAPTRALAHCDALDGPVVKAAQQALETRNPTLVLIWVQAGDEAEIRGAFERTLAVRGLTSEARELADRFFFETVVRVHRAGEGAPFTGLKPAGRDLGPAIPAADMAIENGSDERLVELLTHTTQRGVRSRFDEVIVAKDFKPGDVAAGREYVRRYVAFIHYVERLYEASASEAHSHADSR
jgi:hypothetical protein